MATKVFEDTISAGPIGDKQERFIMEENILEVGWIGAANTGKSRGLCAAINKSAIDYPGAILFLFRGTLQDLTNTTLDTLMTVYKDLDIEQNKQRHIVSWPPDERTGLVSTCVCFGVNTGDYVTKMKSFGPFRAFGDEINECVGVKYPDEKLDFAILRVRQEVRHRLSYRQRIIQMVKDEELPNEQAGFDHFLIEPQELDVHAIGNPYVKYCANDSGNDWVWNRLVNFYGDKPHPPNDEAFWRRTYGMNAYEGYEKWVHENVGMTEIVIPHHEVRAEVLYPGVLIEGGPTSDTPGEPDVVAKVGKTAVKGKTGKVWKVGDFSVILERLAIYGFMLENHSGNPRNFLAHWMVRKEMRDQYMFGLSDIKTGLMHPQVTQDTHVIANSPVPSFWPIEVYLDYNIDYPTAVFVAENTLGDLIVFDDYEGTAIGTEANALAILGKLRSYGISLDRVTFIADPTMWARDKADPSRSIARDYEDAGLKPMMPAINDRQQGITALQAALTPTLRPIGRGRWAEGPQLWWMARAMASFSGTENSKGISTMTWELWRLKRQDHFPDCLRYGIATRRQKDRRPDDEQEDQRRSLAGSSVPRWVR